MKMDLGPDIDWSVAESGPLARHPRGGGAGTHSRPSDPASPALRAGCDRLGLRAWGSNKVYTDTLGGVPRIVDWISAML
ncbi:MAG: hypothetical protein ABFS46_15210, partial [Myxococcota bacterium]